MTKEEIKNKVLELLSQMSVEEKIAQMTQISYADCTKEEARKWAKLGIGSFLHVLGDDARELQSIALSNRLGIPLLFGIDAVHGHCLNRKATIFPCQLGLASSFNRNLTRKVGRATAKEVAADGLHWTFSPILCLGRDPRWGRIDETFGEDPYLAGELGAELIRGYQGECLSDDDSIIACAKHYIGLGEAVGARDSTDTEITERKLREVFLPPFKKAVDAGCATFMTAYGSLDGIPMTSNRKVIHDILRKELGFEGFLVTDWDNVKHLVEEQRVADNIKTASLMSANAGNDMIMKTSEFFKCAVELVNEGILDEKIVDEAVSHILYIKLAMGLFDNPEKKIPREVIGCEEHKTLSMEAARESIVMLKNKNALPLKAKTIAVIGPNADDVRAQYGDWTYFTHPHKIPEQIEPERPYTTVLEGIKEEFPESTVVYHKGCSIFESEDDDIVGAVDTARNADAIILVLGDNAHQTGERKDRADLNLSGRQEELFDKLRELNKTLVTVLIESKPLTIPRIAEETDALLISFNGGMYIGKAIGEVIKGTTNPSGRLPISIANHVGQVPVYYNQLPGWHGGKYCDLPQHPLYTFGEGIGYSNFKYENLSFDVSNYSLNVCVTNIGEKEGTETVQVYFSDVVSSVMTPIKTLIAFDKVSLTPGEKKNVSIALNREDFSLVDSKNNKVVEPGDFILYVGHSSKDEDLLSFPFRL